MKPFRIPSTITLILILLFSSTACMTLEMGVESSEGGTTVQPVITAAPTPDTAVLPTPLPDDGADPGVDPAPPGEPDLTGLIYARNNELWMVESNGEYVKRFEEYIGLALSPDGAFALEGGDRATPWRIRMIHLETGESTDLTYERLDSLNINPQWWEARPETILFLSQLIDPSTRAGGPGLGRIATVNTDGSGYQVLEETFNSFTLPALSPDGQIIAYDRGTETTYEDGILTPWLYEMGSGPKPFDYAKYGLEIPDLVFGSPSWSPDGKRLAWIISGDITGDGQWKEAVAIFDLESDQVQILHPYTPANGMPGYNWLVSAPKWSPDGEWVVWEGFPEGGGAGFWVLRTDGTEERYFGDQFGPIWSPDGYWLAFGAGGPDLEIQIMRVEEWEPFSAGLPSGSMLLDWIIPAR